MKVLAPARDEKHNCDCDSADRRVCVGTTGASLFRKPEMLAIGVREKRAADRLLGSSQTGSTTGRRQRR